MSEAETRELMRTLPVLSIRQPWAWLIVRPDLTDAVARLDALINHEMKPVENREWPDWYPARGFRGRVLIHAGKGMTRADYEACEIFVGGFSDMALPRFHNLQRGGIVGVGTVTRGCTEHPSPWFCGPYALVLDDVEPLTFVPCKGALGIFSVKEAA